MAEPKDKTRTIIVKYESRCRRCDAWINKGETARWTPGLGLEHVECVDYPEPEDDLGAYE